MTGDTRFLVRPDGHSRSGGPRPRPTPEPHPAAVRARPAGTGPGAGSTGRRPPPLPGTPGLRRVPARARRQQRPGAVRHDVAVRGRRRVAWPGRCRARPCWSATRWAGWSCSRRSPGSPPRRVCSSHRCPPIPPSPRWRPSPGGTPSTPCGSWRAARCRCARVPVLRTRGAGGTGTVRAAAAPSRRLRSTSCSCTDRRGRPWAVRRVLVLGLPGRPPGTDPGRAVDRRPLRRPDRGVPRAWATT